jgi:pantetheine-phosphate adenylyltransferase
MPYRTAVYAGTFDPAHFGHIDIATRAARAFDELIVAIYDNPMGKRLLFDVDERTDLMTEALKALPNVKVARYSGLTVDYVKHEGAFALIRGLRVFSDFEYEFRMALANRRLAPNIEMMCFIADERYLHISSTTVREIASLGGDVSSMVPPHIMDALKLKYSEPPEKP